MSSPNDQASPSAGYHIKDVPTWLWLWLVPMPYVIQLIFRYLDPQTVYYEKIFVGEASVTELSTALFLFLSIILALICAKMAKQRDLSAMAILLVIYALGCLFFFGEEISWGQHLFEWQSPEYFLEHNKRSETNLHNMAFFNKSIPKWAVVIGMTIGGVLLPYIFSRKNAHYRPGTHWIHWLFPTWICAPASAIVFLSNLAAKIPAINETARFIGVRESTELYISIFFLIYIWSLYIRFKSFYAATQPDAAIGP